jgi:hypothetical protein
METPANVRIYFDAIQGEPRRGRLLLISPAGYYEVSLQTAGGSVRALLPIAHTFVLAAEAEETIETWVEVER